MLLLTLILMACEQSDNEKITYPDAQSESAQLYVEKCSGCHAAPSPTIHPKTMWPGIVDRMQMRMVNKAIQPMTEQEVEIIVNYLHAHAKNEE